MKLSKILTSALLATLAQASLAEDQVNDRVINDQVILEMQQAFTRGQQSTLTELLPSASGHPLQVWAHYWELKNRLERKEDADSGQLSKEVQQFLEQWSGTYLEDRLRNDWLLILGQRRQWEEFGRLHPHFRMQDDPQLQCYELVREYRAKSLEPTPALAQTLTNLWLGSPNSDEGCNYAARFFTDQGVLPQEAAWLRARHSVQRNWRSSTKAALEILAPAHSATASVKLLLDSPAKYLAQIKKREQDKTASTMIALAMMRMAASQPEQARAHLLDSWGKELSPIEQDAVWGAIGRSAAQKLSSESAGYFQKVQNLDRLLPEELEWMARSALRSGDWAQVQRTIRAMPLELARSSTWTYWQARALLAQPQTEEHQRKQALWALKGIAGSEGFYEQLALELVDQRVHPEPEPPPLSEQELADARNHPGLQRALYAIDLGLRSEGVREWNYTTNLHDSGGMPDRQLFAAAHVACEAQLWDRCINTSERTRNFSSWSQRYPMPFRSEVLQRTKSIDLDPAYVYGLIRQESRFITDARSHVGASGLMQVMPATAKWTAKKIGMSDFQPDMINQHDVNITIGTAYLKLALDEFGGSMPLAAAGYNAGPARPRRWRTGADFEAAIWIENIPFNETRDYVKKVLSNTTTYAAHITGKPQRLSERLKIN